MASDPLVPMNLDGVFLFYSALAVVLLVLFWWLFRRAKATRKAYFSQFNPSELRMNAHQVNVVYRVVSADDQNVTVVRIWDGRSPIRNAPQRVFRASELIPFSEDRFFN